MEYTGPTRKEKKFDVPRLNKNLYYLCSKQGKEQEIREYIQKGADVNFHSVAENGYTPLHTACKSGIEGTVRVLLELGADINNTKNSLGQSPLHLAARKGILSLLKILVDN